MRRTRQPESVPVHPSAQAPRFPGTPDREARVGAARCRVALLRRRWRASPGGRRWARIGQRRARPDHHRLHLFAHRRGSGAVLELTGRFEARLDLQNAAGRRSRTQAGAARAGRSDQSLRRSPPPSRKPIPRHSASSRTALFSSSPPSTHNKRGSRSPVLTTTVRSGAPSPTPTCSPQTPEAWTRSTPSAPLREVHEGEGRHRAGLVRLWHFADVHPRRDRRRGLHEGRRRQVRSRRHLHSIRECRFHQHRPHRKAGRSQRDHSNHGRQFELRASRGAGADGRQAEGLPLRDRVRVECDQLAGLALPSKAPTGCRSTVHGRSRIPPPSRCRRRWTSTPDSARASSRRRASTRHGREPIS